MHWENLPFTMENRLMASASSSNLSVWQRVAFIFTNVMLNENTLLQTGDEDVPFSCPFAYQIRILSENNTSGILLTSRILHEVTRNPTVSLSFDVHKWQQVKYLGHTSGKLFYICIKCQLGEPWIAEGYRDSAIAPLIRADRTLIKVWTEKVEHPYNVWSKGQTTGDQT